MLALMTVSTTSGASASAVGRVELAVVSRLDPPPGRLREALEGRVREQRAHVPLQQAHVSAHPAPVLLVCRQQHKPVGGAGCVRGAQARGAARSPRRVTRAASLGLTRCTRQGPGGGLLGGARRRRPAER